VNRRPELKNKERLVRTDLSVKLNVYLIIKIEREVGRCSGGLLSSEVQVGA
jgi:hypothetical protein